MGRPKKPAVIKKGQSESKEQLESRALIEEKLRGGDDLVYDYVPKTLSEDSQNYYRFIIRELKVSGILSNLDIPVLEEISYLLGEIIALKSDIKEQGRMLQKVDRNGNSFPIENPAINTYIKYLDRFNKLAAQLGLNPASRATLAAMNVDEQIQEDDPVAKALSDTEDSDSSPY